MKRDVQKLSWGRDKKKIENIENICFHLRFWLNRCIFYLKQIIRQKNSKLENFIRVSRFSTVWLRFKPLTVVYFMTSEFFDLRVVFAASTKIIMTTKSFQLLRSIKVNITMNARIIMMRIVMTKFTFHGI